MSNLKFISDLHLGHKGVFNWARENRQGTTIEEHDDWIVSTICANLSKRDTLYILGDVSFDLENFEKHMSRIKSVCPNLYLVRGNHDTFNTGVYLKYFREVYGIVKKKGYWLSHCPIHPNELFRGDNIHGHVHNKGIYRPDYKPIILQGKDRIIKDLQPLESRQDKRYISVCIESCQAIPVSLEEIKNGDYFKRMVYFEERKLDI